MDKGAQPETLVVRVDPGVRRDDGARSVVTHPTEAARVRFDIESDEHLFVSALDDDGPKQPIPSNFPDSRGRGLATTTTPQPTGCSTIVTTTQRHDARKRTTTLAARVDPGLRRGDGARGGVLT
jgi:hypothetical protein